MASSLPPAERPEDETLDELYENAPCGYLTVDAAGLIVRTNMTLLAWLGVERDALVGRRVQAILTAAGRIFFETHVSPILATEGKARQVAIDLRCAGNRRMAVLTDWRRIDAGSRPLGLRAMLVDATDRRAYERDLVAERERAREAAVRLRESEARLLDLNQTLEARVAERSAALELAHEQLRQSQKLEAMGSLTGGVAHDFNNLLTPIVGGLDMLQRRGVGDERAQRLIAGALASAEKARTLVHRLLAFARRQPLQPVAVDVGALVRGMSGLIASTSGPRIRLATDVADGLPPALADANQIEMALLNLSVNARDAMPDGGTLTLTVAEDATGDGDRSARDRYIRLTVADTGVGMDEATLARAVEPFFSTKGVGRGTGLGLSMVHGLAAQLGGRLELRSRPGLGTCVELWLPVAEAKAKATGPARGPSEPGGTSGVVLLVDDEELVRASTADMLVEMGYEVVEASSATTALRFLDDGLRPDLIVTDHLMPGMTGTDLARKVTARSDVPILIVSGYADVEAVAPELPRLAKPFRQDHLADALASLRRPAERPGTDKVTIGA